MKKTIAALLLSVPLAGFANPELCELVRGAKVFAQDEENTYLGTVTNSVAYESIFNDIGPHGSDIRRESIWNDISPYGSSVMAISAMNSMAVKPPFMIKGGKVIGYLTANKSMKPGINPKILKALCAEQL